MSTSLDEHSSQRPQRDYTGLLRSLFFIIIIAASAGIIFYLKSATSGPLSPQSLDPNSRLVAHPDTSVSEDNNVNAAAPAKTPVASDNAADYTPNDSIDHRPPYDAGYEDGYNTGYFDGTRGEYRLTYDESSTYAAAADQNAYRSAYQQGYKAGFDDGRNGKTFSIFNNTNEEDEEDETVEELIEE